MLFATLRVPALTPDIPIKAAAANLMISFILCFYSLVWFVSFQIILKRRKYCALRRRLKRLRPTYRPKKQQQKQSNVSFGFLDTEINVVK